MASLSSLVALLGDGQSFVDSELLQAECAELTKDPALDSVLTPLFERRFGIHPHSIAPNLIMQGALDAPGTPLFDAALVHWPNWKAPVLVHARLELPLLKVGAMAVTDDTVIIGHDKGLTFVDRTTLEARSTQPVKGFVRHVHVASGGRVRAMVKGKTWSLLEGELTLNERLFTEPSEDERFIFEGGLACRFTPKVLEWVDLESDAPRVSRVDLSVLPEPRRMAVDGASGRMIWVEGPDVVLFHARENRREVQHLPGVRLVGFLSDASPALEVERCWRTFTSARETNLPLRRTTFLGHHVFVGDHCRKTDSVCVTTKSHRTYCPLGKGDFDQLVVAGDLIFVASSKKPAAVQALRLFEPPR